MIPRLLLTFLLSILTVILLSGVDSSLLTTEAASRIPVLPVKVVRRYVEVEQQAGQPQIQDDCVEVLLSTDHDRRRAVLGAFDGITERFKALRKRFAESWLVFDQEKLQEGGTRIGKN